MNERPFVIMAAKGLVASARVQYVLECLHDPITR